MVQLLRLRKTAVMASFLFGSDCLMQCALLKNKRCLVEIILMRSNVSLGHPKVLEEDI
jgi:hypothetical protein